MASNLPNAGNQPLADKYPIYEGADQLFDQYWKYASSLKQWYIGFGIGLLVLLVSHPELFTKLSDVRKNWIFGLFFSAIFIQVTLAYLNKMTEYYLYLEKMGYSIKNKKRFKFSYRFSSCFWIECLGDILTGALYILGVLILLYI